MAEESLWTRIRDRDRAPRRWWWPPTTEPDLDSEELRRHHDATSHTVRRTVFALLGFGLFCLLTLGQPDTQLIASDATVDVPLARVKVSYAGFLIVGPLIVVGLTLYLHVFLGYWHGLGGRHSRQKLPFLFNMPSTAARILSGFLLYWMTPLIMGVFTWKALARREGFYMFWVAWALTVWLIYCQIRRTPDDKRTRRVPLLVVALLVVLGTGVAAMYNPLLLRRSMNLQGSDLSGLSLRGGYLVMQNLSAADLSRADLTRADLSLANLTGARLRDAVLFQTTFTGANLTRADLSGADLRTARIGPVLPAATSGAVLREADLRGAKLRYKDLTNAVFDNADLSRADLRNTKLFMASFAGATLTGTDLREADLVPVRELTQEQLNTACLDVSTKLPPEFTRPAPCPLAD